MPSLRLIPLAVLLISMSVGLNAWSQTKEQMKALSATTNTTLEKNKSVAKAQGMSAASNMLDKSGFDFSNGVMDYQGMQNKAGLATGVGAQNFGASDGAGNLSFQSASVMISCKPENFGKAQRVAGLVIRTLGCTISDPETLNEQVTLKFQMCTAPIRGLPVKAPDNEVECGASPSDADYYPPPGKVCKKPSCETEGIATLNGWSAEKQLTFSRAVVESSTASDAQKQENGLKVVMFPDLSAGANPGLGSDSETFAAIRIAGVTPVFAIVDGRRKLKESLTNNVIDLEQYNKQMLFLEAGMELYVGAKVGFRAKQIVRKSDMENGTLPSSSSSLVSSQEHRIVADFRKINEDPTMGIAQTKIGSTMAPCIDNMFNAIENDGNVSICNTGYGATAAAKANKTVPAETTLQVARQGKQCQTTTQCLQELVKTTAYEDKCDVAIPLANKECITTRTFTETTQTMNRTLPEELCTEKRGGPFQYSCLTQSVVTGVTKGCTAGSPCLVVPSCEIGKTYSISVTGSSGMGNDSFKGGDSLWITWECTHAEYPKITMHSGEIHSQVVPNNGEALTNSYTSGQPAKFVNNTTCKNGQCSGTYILILLANKPTYQSRCTSAGCAGGPTTCSLGFKDEYGKIQACESKSFLGRVPNDAYVTGYTLQETSYGAASRITATGDFSMADLYTPIINISNNSCSSLESANQP